MITQEKIDYYVNYPYNCPFCDSKHIESPSSENEQDCTIMTANVYCNDCNKKWKEVYSLTGLIEIE